MHQKSWKRTPEQDGVVEREHHLPLQFYGECVSTIAYLITVGSLALTQPNYAYKSGRFQPKPIGIGGIISVL